MLVNHKPQPLLLPWPWLHIWSVLMREKTDVISPQLQRWEMLWSSDVFLTFIFNGSGCAFEENTSKWLLWNIVDWPQHEPEYAMHFTKTGTSIKASPAINQIKSDCMCVLVLHLHPIFRPQTLRIMIHRLWRGTRLDAGSQWMSKASQILRGGVKSIYMTKT